MTDMHEFADHVIRTFHVTRQRVEKVVKQFHFTTWPDFGVPQDPYGILAFLRKVNSWKDPNSTSVSVTIYAKAWQGSMRRYGSTLPPVLI